MGGGGTSLATHRQLSSDSTRHAWGLRREKAVVTAEGLMAKHSKGVDWLQEAWGERGIGFPG